MDSGFYFVQDAYNFIYPLLQVESRSGSVEKSNGSGWGTFASRLNAQYIPQHYLSWQRTHMFIKMDLLQVFIVKTGYGKEVAVALVDTQVRYLDPKNWRIQSISSPDPSLASENHGPDSNLNLKKIYILLFFFHASFILLKWSFFFSFR